MPDPNLKKQLGIALAEPVVFLRTQDPSGRLQSDSTDPPTLVRGILTLNVTKPIGISTVQVELSAILAVNYPEILGSQRIEHQEKHKIYSSTVSVFRADQVRQRYSASVGPGVSTAYSNADEPLASPRLTSLPRGRSERRNIPGVPPDPGPTPPYSPAQPLTPIQLRLGAHAEHPSQTLEELRQALRDNLEGQTGSISPSSPAPSVFSIPRLTLHSNVSSGSNGSLQRETDSRIDDFEHPGSPLEADASSHNHTEETSHVLPHRGSSLSRGRPFRAHSPENSHGSQPSTRGRSRDPSNTPASHSRLRLSLASVLDAVKEVTSRAPSRSRSVARSEERERGRTRVRIVPEEEGRSSILEVDEGVAVPRNGHLGHNPSPTSSHLERREHHPLGLGRVFGDHEKDKDGEPRPKENGESWKEFQPGTYSYPISFLLPPHLPPTFSLPSGSLNYTIKGIAHRPGTFTPKLTCQVPLLVVASPAIGTGEGGLAGDPGPLFVQKEWQGKLAYSIGLSSRLFLLGSERRLGQVASESSTNTESSTPEVGAEARAEAAYGTATLDLTLLPTEKVKIWRLDAFVDQRIKYFDERGRPFSEEDKKQVRLLEVHDTCSAEEMDEEQTRKNKHKHKHDVTRIPLLPTPVSPHRSPLLRFLPPSSDPSILAGPGPYVLSTNIGLPGCSDTDRGLLHFTVKQKSSYLRVEHSLRLVIRVEAVGDEDTKDHDDGEKNRLFDIAVQTPIAILSCRCIPEYQTLPRYSQITQDNSRYRAMCPCRASIVGNTEQDLNLYSEHVIAPSPTSTFDTESRVTDDRHSRSPSCAPGGGGRANPLTASLHPHPSSPVSRTRETGWNRSPAPSHAQHLHAPAPSYTVSTSHVRRHSETPPVTTPHTSRPPSPLARYERLVSGMESEAGEAPPSYESVASGA